MARHRRGGRQIDQSAECKVGLRSDPAVVADRRRQFGGWEWPGTILPTDSIVVLTDFDRIARLHIGGEPLVMCYGSQRQRSAPQGQRSLWPSHGFLQALATNGKDAPSVRMRHRHLPPTGPHERFLRKRSSESGRQLEPPACAIAQSRASGWRGPHDRFRLPAASRRTIALATLGSSGPTRSLRGGGRSHPAAREAR